MNIEAMDVVKEKADFILYGGTKPFLTPEGDRICHVRARLPQHLLRELSGSASNPDNISGLTVYRTRKTMEKRGSDPILLQWIDFITIDPLVDKAAFDKATNQNNNHDYVVHLLENQQHLTFFFTGLASVVQCFKDFLLDFSQGHFDFAEKSPKTIAKALFSAYERLTPDKKAATQLLCCTHACGIVLPLMLVLEKITASEYVNALFGLHYPQKGGHQPNNEIFMQKLDQKPEIPLYLPDWEHPGSCYSLLREQAWAILDYLACAAISTRKHIDLHQLIKQGEHFNTEFKTSLRWNVKSDRKDPAIEHAALKTITAFLNSAGGTLLIGVRDDGSIAGIGIDHFVSEDKYALHFWNIVKASIGQNISSLIRTSFEQVDGQQVFHVHCYPSPEPVFLHQKGFEEEFFIRIGPSSSRLSVREALKYIAGRFED